MRRRDAAANTVGAAIEDWPASRPGQHCQVLCHRWVANKGCCVGVWCSLHTLTLGWRAGVSQREEAWASGAGDSTRGWLTENRVNPRPVHLKSVWQLLKSLST